MSTENIETLSLWNGGDQILTPHASLLEIIYAQAQQRPDSLAVCAWDGRWSYQELNDEAWDACAYLRREIGIKAGNMIFFRANKSKWAVVALAAILYTGATCIPIDIRVPRDRIQQIQVMTGAILLISTTETTLLDIKDCQTVQLPLTNSSEQNRQSGAYSNHCPRIYSLYLFSLQAALGCLKG